jgi:hypothetical protein
MTGLAAGVKETSTETVKLVWGGGDERKNRQEKAVLGEAR